MTVKVGSNIGSLRALRQLSRVSEAQASTQERLASGQRINRASDDAAGLAIASTLESRSKVFTQAIRNLSDGSAFLNVADAALTQLTDITTRIAELSEQAANGVYSVRQRQALDAEAGALTAEYSRILQTSQFNNINVFQAGKDGLRLQGGFGISQSNLIQFGQSLAASVGTGTFGAMTTTSVAGSLINFAFEERVLSGDYDGDGNADLVTAQHTGGNTSLFYYFGDGAGGLSSAVVGQTAVNGGSIVQADFNEDGRLDQIIGFGHPAAPGFRFSTVSTSRVLTEPFMNQGGPREVTVAGDFDLDGHQDIITADGTLYFQKGLGDGTFQVGVTIMTRNYENAEAADVNGDGRLDLLLADASTTTLYLGTGTGGFGGAVTLATGLNSGGMTTADLNGDGNVDYLRENSGEILYYLGQGNGSFAAAATFSTGTSTQVVGVSDLNRDGSVDVVTESTGGLVTFFGNGNGTFRSGITTSLGATHPEVLLADLNSDGVADYVGVNDGVINIALANVTEAFIAPTYDLTTQANARSSLATAQSTLASLAAERSKIGAHMAALEVRTNVLRVGVESERSARSRIMDADMAEETALLLQRQITLQAATATLAQANIQPELALKLLK